MTRRRMATGVLLLCAVIVLSCYPERFTFWGGFGVHTALAALVGGLADWYAVTALFRRPLGIPWQTEWLPRSREKIMTMAGTMVKDELLTPRHLYRALKAHSPLPYLLTLWERDTERFVRALTTLFETLPDGLSTDLLQHEWEPLRKRILTAQWPADVAAEALLLWQKEDNESGRERLAQWLQSRINAAPTAEFLTAQYEQFMTLLAAKHPVRAKLWQEALRAQGETPSTVGRFLQERLARAAADLARPTTTIGAAFDDMVTMTVARLQNDRRLRRQITDAVAPLLATNIPTDSQVLFDLIVTPKRRHAFAQTLATLAVRWLTAARQDPVRIRKLERLLFVTLAKMLPLVQPYFGTWSQAALAPYSARELSDLIEAKVSDDLQMIRLNGTLIGGVLGAVFYVLGHAMLGGGF